jgi:hypothetical protein
MSKENIFEEKLEWDWEEYYRDLNVYFNKKKREWPTNMGRITDKAKELGIKPDSDEMINWILRQALMGMEQQIQRVNDWWFGDHLRPQRHGGENASDRSRFWKYGPIPDLHIPGYCAICHEASSGMFSDRKGPAILVILDGEVKAIHAGCFQRLEEEE